MAYRLVLKGKKDKGIFKDRFDAQHNNSGNLSKDDQNAGLHYVMNKVFEMKEDLKSMGYDPCTIYFAISEKT